MKGQQTSESGLQLQRQPLLRPADRTYEAGATCRTKGEGAKPASKRRINAAQRTLQRTNSLDMDSHGAATNQHSRGTQGPVRRIAASASVPAHTLTASRCTQCHQTHCNHPTYGVLSSSNLLLSSAVCRLAVPTAATPILAPAAVSAVDVPVTPSIIPPLP
jgi:hypothetical protein